MDLTRLVINTNLISYKIPYYASLLEVIPPQYYFIDVGTGQKSGVEALLSYADCHVPLAVNLNYCSVVCSSQVELKSFEFITQHELGGD